MNNNRSLQWIMIGCCALVVSLTTGCSHWIELIAAPADLQEHGSHMIARDEQVPLILEHFRVTLNGAPQNPSPNVEDRVLGSLAEIGLFSHLAGATFSTPASDEKVVHATLLFDETIDPHPGDAAWKGIVLGASMFILTPFIPLEYDYAAHVALELERWDGQIKRYESRSAGTVRYHLFGATPIMIEELKGFVTESCLTSLAQQLAQDTTFYAASNAPVKQPGIRTVTVKPRSPETSVPIRAMVHVPAPTEP